MDVFQIISVGSILAIFFAGFVGLNRETGYFSIIAQNAPTLLTSAGIFFTFLGIFVALLNFDTLQIDKAIPRLLAGLQLAFLSSVVGIGSSMLFRGVVAPMRAPEGKVQDATVADLLDELRSGTKATQAVQRAILGNEEDGNVLRTLQATKDGIDGVKEALTGEGDASLSTQFSKLRNDFRDFAESVKESGTNALIEALEQVIKDFNQKISEQFGENFKQLNEAVGSLLQWQAEHKVQVQQLTEAFRETQQGIDSIREALSGVESNTGVIPKHMEKLEGVHERLDQQIIEMTSSIGTLAEVREAAKNLVPELNASINGATETLAEAFAKQNTTLTENLQKGAAQQADNQTELGRQLNKVISEATQQTSALTESLKSKMSESVDRVTDAVAKQASLIAESVKDATNKQTESQALIKSATDEMKQALEKNLDDSNKTFAQQMEKFQGVLDSMNIGADNLLSATEKVAKDVDTMIDKFGQAQEEASRQTNRKIEESIAANTEALNKSMQALDSSMQDQLQRALNLMGNNLTSITEQFVRTYESSARNIVELTEKISRDRR